MTARTFVDWWKRCEKDLAKRVTRGGVYGNAADDLLQDAALYVWARRDELESPEDLRRLAFFKVRYLLLDHYRSVRKSEPAPIDVDLFGEQPTGELMEYQEAWSRLPERQRDVVSLVLGGRSYRWIAMHYDISEATVRSLWRLAKHKLAQAAVTHEE